MLFPRYDRQGASSRLRSHQFIPSLGREGIQVDAFPLLPNEYLDALYQRGKRSLSLAVGAYVRRVRTLLRGGSYDLIWVEKELLPWIPLFIEQLLLQAQVPLML